jgi:hypothetical protein
VPEIGLEAFFSLPTKDKKVCDSMLQGSWPGGALSLRKYANLPRPPRPKLSTAGTVVAVGAGLSFLAIMVMLWWARRGESYILLTHIHCIYSVAQ